MEKEIKFTYKRNPSIPKKKDKRKVKFEFLQKAFYKKISLSLSIADNTYLASVIDTIFLSSYQRKQIPAIQKLSPKTP